MNKQMVYGFVFPVVLLTLTLTTFQSAQAADVKQAAGRDLDVHYSTLAECDKALSQNQNDFNAWVDRGVIHSNMGLEDEAVMDFNKAAEVLDSK